jgi:pimeloyl-ACP methyl ester carboxylesterase
MEIQDYKHELDKFDGLQISNYIYSTTSDTVLIVLHGWNTTGLQSWREFLDQAKDLGVNILAVEMPAFGDSQDPKEVWGVKEYAKFIDGFVSFKLSKEEKLKVTQKYLLGHSFGGAVSSLIATYNQTYKSLFLLAPAIIRSQQTNSRVTQITKVFKNIFEFPLLKPSFNLARKVWYKLLGSSDYIQTSGIKKQIMQKILRQDITAEAYQLDIFVYLFWGDKDKYTPYSQALQLSKNIKNCSLNTYPGINHGLHLYRSKEIIEEIKTVLSSSN